MKICVLASGSKGNATYIETPQTKILFDIGVNVKYITNALADLNVDPNEIEYIFISHSHSDHVKALNTFLKKYHPKVCLTLGILYELEDIKEYDNLLVFDKDIDIADCHIETIKTSHDTNDSRGFIITANDKSVVYLTDTGYLNQKYFKTLANREIYLFESNHDPEMLINGSYPDWLKARIGGAYGHLSNVDSAIYISKLIGPKTQKIVLMHLSEENNTEEKALTTLKETLAAYNIEFSNYTCARQHEKSEVMEL